MKKFFILFSILLFTVSCAYYNTFFNAQKRYELAFKKQKTVKSEKLPSDIVTNYNAAIKKCWNLIDTYGDSSKWADNALLMIGKSYYNLAQYEKAQRVFEQFILKYNNSELIPEANLWLAKTYIGLEKENRALELLDGLFSEDIESSIAAQIYYILGDLYYQSEDYEKALENLLKVEKYSGEDELLGNTWFTIGEIYFSQEEYEKSIDAYKKLEDLEIPILREYEARIQEAEGYIALEDYEQAEMTLKKMLRDIRFKAQFSLIDAKLANISELQGLFDFARDAYYDIFKKYNWDEGSSLAAFNLAQLYEFEYGQMDSAKLYYDKVKASRQHPDLFADSRARSTLLKEYLKIRDQLRRDARDLWRIAHGDSTLEDSLEVPVDTLQDNSAKSQLGLDREAPDIMVGTRDLARQDKGTLDDKKGIDSTKVVKPKKVAVSRKPEEVEKSHRSTSFKRGEFFLLKYENFDSALVAYRDFLQSYPNDSVLTPKAEYALYFIHHDLKHDSLRADSIKKIILDYYPDTPYGRKLSGKPVVKKVDPKKDVLTSQAHQNYLAAENYMNQGQYRKAIDLFTEIAVSDSGNTTAQKSLYAIAYIYEHLLNDTTRALKAYHNLLNQYSKGPYASIARNKTKEPVKGQAKKSEEPEMEAELEAKRAARKVDRESSEKKTPQEKALLERLRKLNKAEKGFLKNNSKKVQK